MDTLAIDGQHTHLVAFEQRATGGRLDINTTEGLLLHVHWKDGVILAAFISGVALTGPRHVDAERRAAQRLVDDDRRGE